ncbi:glycosyltransferase [uncultured Pelagimonas sp.]|uniref:glycosyltransferase n=1 Tax=uncultured Pelagimonas sp. TaxID=1618102 RepID=UPI002620257E|nr:glycosyltransferase [uncultured Pelagimonas sp.]
MQVLVAPDGRSINPYQQLLADAAAPLGLSMTFLQGYRRVLPLSRAIRTQKPDLLHLHWPSHYLRSDRTFLRTAYCLRTLSDLKLVQMRGIPVVWTVHNLVTHDTPTPRLERWFSSRLAKLADRLIVHSPAAREAVIETLGADEDKIDIIPHGSFRSAYGALPDRAGARAALDIAPDRPVVLFFGMIRPYKGVPNLLSAWEALGDQRKDGLLVVAGSVTDDAYGEEIRSQAEATPQTRLELRYIRDDELTLLLAAADVLVLPFENSLTSGTVTLAQDYGLPVVVPQVAGSEGARGAIFAKDTTPAPLGAAILTGLAAGRSRPELQEDTTWDNVARRHAEVFQAAFERRNG